MLPVYGPRVFKCLKTMINRLGFTYLVLGGPTGPGGPNGRIPPCGGPLIPPPGPTEYGLGAFCICCILQCCFIRFEKLVLDIHL